LRAASAPDSIKALPNHLRSDEVTGDESRGSHLCVLLLGGFRLQVGGALTELPAASQRMVALLALRGAMSRSRLAGSLWPETPEERALASLRTSIWRTNCAARELVACHGGMVDLGPQVVVDTRSFVVRALRFLGSQGGAAGDPGAAGVGELVGENELLPDWDDEWIVAERERLRQLHLHFLEAMAGHLSLSGDFGLAIEVALAALRIEPLRESAHRLLIRIHLLEGNVVEARRAFSDCRRTLRREVGVDVSPETLRLVPAEMQVLTLPAPR
jgi:DNA-binding SARP family transcriptional activator